MTTGIAELQARLAERERTERAERHDVADANALARWKNAARSGLILTLWRRKRHWRCLPLPLRERWLREGMSAAASCFLGWKCVSWFFDVWEEYYSAQNLDEAARVEARHAMKLEVADTALSCRVNPIVHLCLDDLTAAEVRARALDHLSMIHDRYWRQKFADGIPPLPADFHHFQVVLRSLNEDDLQSPFLHLRLALASATLDVAAIDSAIELGVVPATLWIRALVSLVEASRLIGGVRVQPHANIDRLLRHLKIGMPEFPEMPCWLFVRRNSSLLGTQFLVPFSHHDGASVPPDLQLLRHHQLITPRPSRPKLAPSPSPSATTPVDFQVRIFAQNWNIARHYVGLTGPLFANEGPGYDLECSGQRALEVFEKDTELRGKIAAEWWALIALHADGCVEVTHHIISESEPSGYSNSDGIALSGLAAQQCRVADLRRFFAIAGRLPHDLQVVLSNRLMELGDYTSVSSDLHRATRAVLVAFFL